MKHIIPLLFIASLTLYSFKKIQTVNNCFLTFKGVNNLNVSETKQLPESSEKFRIIKTENGEVRISRIDGYRVIYTNEKRAPVVNMKIELSDPDSFKNDKARLIENLDYLNKHSIGMETKTLIEKEMNGYKIYGFSRGSIDEGSTQSTFLIFTKNTVIYFYFNNLKTEYRTYTDLEDYKKQRDNFIDAFTKHLAKCKD